MLQVYSVNQTFTDGAAVPLNNTGIAKGCTAVLGAPATIELNRMGIYMVSVNASLTGTAAGEGQLQLTKNGVALPMAQASETLDTTPAALSFMTLVQVSQNNTLCCCSSPVSLQVIYTGDDATGDINVCVTKIC